jgi:hypothetical protein
MKPDKKIPTAEDFDRASRLMKQRSHMLDAVRDAFRHEFTARHSLHEFFIIDQRDADFRAYVFLKTEKDLAAAKENGVCTRMEDFIYSQLERVGRGTRGSIQVAFEFDSHERVKANFGGNYFLRLR